jgi:hypothetical protein
MTPQRRSEFDVFCRQALGWLDACGVEHLVVGGLAVVAVGEPRTTADIDVIAFVDPRRAEALVAEALAAGFEADEEAERRRLEETGTLRLARGLFHLDVIVASLPFERAALSRSFVKTMFGRPVRLPTPEDLILLKVVAGRDKDLLDAVGVVRRHSAHLDRRYIEATLQELCDLGEDLGPWQRWNEVLRRGGTEELE